MAQATVELHPEAIAEAHAAATWYRDRSELAEAAFLSELDHAIRRIEESPRSWPRYVAGTRRYLLRRFPFAAVYREHEHKIQVVATAHVRRLPGYWRGR